MTLEADRTRNREYMRRKKGTPGWLPVEPILPFIRRRALAAAYEAPQRASHAESGLRSLADLMSARFGTDLQAEHRLLLRVAGGHTKRLNVNTADRLAVICGCHPIEIWGDRWMGGVA